MAISRSEGYRRSAGKEEGGLAAAEHFFRSVLDLPVRRIEEQRRTSSVAISKYSAPDVLLNASVNRLTPRSTERTS
jgi:hypothetical protein